MTKNSPTPTPAPEPEPVPEPTPEPAPEPLVDPVLIILGKLDEILAAVNRPAPAPSTPPVNPLGAMAQFAPLIAEAQSKAKAFEMEVSKAFKQVLDNQVLTWKAIQDIKAKLDGTPDGTVPR